ncbi:MAG: tripartite tricarboxylate transporter permease, partial [Candidatus Nanohaloarchaea archaeon]
GGRPGTASMFSLLAALAAGMGCGVVTGLLPGLHPNAVIFLVLPVYLETRPPTMMFVAFAAGMSTVHTFTSFIPSVFVGAPEGDTALSALPGHQLLHEGRGREAVELTVAGGVVATALAVAALPVLFLVVPAVYRVAAAQMHLLLTAVLGYLVLTDRNPSGAAVVVVLAGVLGLGVLHSPLANTQYVLFPLFSGMFGLSIIFESLATGMETPPQGRSLPVRPGDAFDGGWKGFLAGVVAGFLPGVGSSQTILLVERGSEQDVEGFLAAMGGVTTTDLFFSLAALYLIGNPRSGAAVAMQQVLPSVDIYTVLQVIGMSLVGVGGGAVVTRRSLSVIVDVLHRLEYRRLLVGTTAFIVVGTVVLAGGFGLLVLVTATALGIFTARTGVRRSTCMAVLIVPTILFYAGIAFPFF